MNSGKPTASLERRSVVSAFWSGISTYGNVMLSFLVFLVLARLLSPDEFGLVAIASVFVDIILIVSRGGLPEAVVQRPNLEEEFADTAFWLSSAAGAIFCLLLALGSPALAYLFGLEALAPVLAALSLALLFGGMGAIHEARLQRVFAFKQLAMRSLAANTIAGAIAVALALHGWGVWAMVAQRLLSGAATTILTWVTSGWIPRARFERSFAKYQIEFGVRIFSATFLNGVNIRLQELIAAAFLSPAAVGYIRLSWRCIDLVSQIAVIPFASVAMTSYSRLQEEGGSPGDAFLGFTRASAALAFPCFFGMAAVAPVMIPVVFGANWAPAVPVLQLLCLTAIPFVTQSFMWSLMVAVGRPERNLQISLLQVVVGSILSVTAAPFGLYAVTFSHLVRTYLVWPVTLRVTRKDAGVSIPATLKSFSMILLISGIMSVSVWAIAHFFGGIFPATIMLVFLIFVGASIYVGAAWIFMPDIARTVSKELSGLVSRRRS